jgi:hypothetical protein
VGEPGYLFVLLVVLQKPFWNPYSFRASTFRFATVTLCPLKHIRASFVAGAN